MQLEIIACYVTTECSAWLLYIDFNESKTTICLKIPTMNNAYGIVYILLNGGKNYNLQAT